jgi:LysR family nitrogen assimilation transcriptional regulator
MDLRALRYFIAVARAESVTRAALQLHVAQPALSRHIGRLEAELGVALLLRHRRGVTLTEPGRLLLEEASALLRQHADLPERLNRVVGVATGDLAIGLPAGLGSLLLPRVLTRFMADCPRVQVHVVEGLSGQLTEMMLAGRLDLAVMNNAARSATIDAEPFLVSRMAFIRAARVSAPRSISLAQVAREPLILASGSHTLRQTIDAAFGARQLTVRPRLEVDSLTLLKALVRSGLGGTLLNPYVVAEEVAQGLLQATPLSGRGITWRLDLAIHRERRQRLAVGTMLRILREEARDVIEAGGLAGSLHLNPAPP